MPHCLLCTLPCWWDLWRHFRILGTGDVSVNSEERVKGLFQKTQCADGHVFASFLKAECVQQVIELVSELVHGCAQLVEAMDAASEQPQLPLLVRLFP